MKGFAAEQGKEAGSATGDHADKPVSLKETEKQKSVNPRQILRERRKKALSECTSQPPLIN